MDIIELRAAFDSIGCRLDVVKTGSPYYERGFIVGPDGVNHGRATIHEGMLMHIKWYSGGFGDRCHWGPTDFISWSFQFYRKYGRPLEKSEWVSAWKQACLMADEDLAAKQRWRECNMKIDEFGDPSPKRRKPLTGRNPRCFLNQILLPE